MGFSQKVSNRFFVSLVKVFESSKNLFSFFFIGGGISFENVMTMLIFFWVTLLELSIYTSVAVKTGMFETKTRFFFKSKIKTGKIFAVY